MHFGVLGPLEVSDGDGPVPLGGPKQRVILAHLVLGANQVVPAEQLLDAVWGEDPPSTAKRTVQAYVSRLRSALGSGRIEGRASGYILRADPGDVDVLRFEQLLRHAREGATDPASTVVTLTEALELWRGPALADLAGEPSLAGEIARLEELHLQATEEKIAAELELGRQADAIAMLEALDPKGRVIATAHADGTAILWDPVTGARRLTVSPAEGGNNAHDVEFSPDGERLATAGLDGVARIWELQPTGARQTLTLAGHSAAIKDVAFSADGSVRATGSDDGTTRTWDLTDGGSSEVFGTTGPEFIGDVHFDPEGRTLFASAAPNGAVGRWDLRTGSRVAEMDHADVFGIDLDATGSVVATAGFDRTVRTWDTSSGEELTSSAAAECPPDEVLCPVFDIRVSTEGGFLATGAADGTARIFDLETGVERLRLDAHADLVFGIDLSSDGSILATASWDGTAKLWDVATGREIGTLDQRSTEVSSVAFSPDGELIATDGTIKVFEASERRLVRELHARGSVFSVAFSPDGSHLVSGGDFVRIWDVATGRELATIPGSAVRVAFSADGSQLATLENEGGPVRVWLLDIDRLLDLARGRLTRTFTVQECRQYRIDPCPAP